MHRGGRLQPHGGPDLADGGRVALLHQHPGNIVINRLLHFGHLRHMSLPFSIGACMVMTSISHFFCVYNICSKIIFYFLLAFFH